MLLAVEVPRDLLVFLVLVLLRLALLEDFWDVVHGLQLVEGVLDVVLDEVDEVPLERVRLSFGDLNHFN